MTAQPPKMLGKFKSNVYLKQHKPQPAKWHDRAVVHHTHHIYCTSCSVFSMAPSSAQTHVNKACDGMSAREVWSRAALRLLLFVALPTSDTLCHPAKFSCRRLPLSFPPLSSSSPTLNAICCAGMDYFYFVFLGVLFRHLVLRGQRAAAEADVTVVPKVLETGNNNLCHVLGIIPV